MEIKIAEISKLIERLLEYEKERGREIFYIKPEYYWNIIEKERYDSFDDPSTFTLGQLSWDWKNLQETLAKKHDPTNLDFVWLGQILIAIGASYWDSNQQKKPPEKDA